MIYWHQWNPWKDSVIYCPSIAEALGQEYDDFVMGQYGHVVDVYILPQPDGHYSCGIRYGRDGAAYLSPYISPDKGKELDEKYRGNGLNKQLSR